MEREDIIINSAELDNWLIDFERNSEVQFLEDAKEKNDLIEIAKAKGILVEGSIDLGIFKAVYIFPDEANGNKTRVPKEELLRKLPTLIGKPIDIDHIRRYAVGYYIDFRYIEKENKVIAYGIIFKKSFEKEWEKILKLFKEKKLTTSYEIWSPKSKRKYLSDGTFELHDIQIGGGAIILNLDNHTSPAFPDAKVLEIYSDKETLYNETINEIKKRNINE